MSRMKGAKKKKKVNQKPETTQNNPLTFSLPGTPSMETKTPEMHQIVTIDNIVNDRIQSGQDVLLPSSSAVVVTTGQNVESPVQPQEFRKRPRKPETPKKTASPPRSETSVKRRELIARYVKRGTSIRIPRKVNPRDCNIRTLPLHQTLNELTQLTQAKPPAVHRRNAQRTTNQDLIKAFEQENCACLVIIDSGHLDGWHNPIPSSIMSFSGGPEFISAILEPEIKDANGETKKVYARHYNQKVSSIYEGRCVAIVIATHIFGAK